MKKILPLLFLTSFCLANPSSNKPPILIHEVDGAPSCFATDLTVSNGSLSCTGSAATLTSGGSSGGAGYNVEPATVTFQLNRGVTASTITVTSSATVTGAGGLGVTYGTNLSTLTIKSLVTSTATLQIFDASNNLLVNIDNTSLTLTPTDYLLTISSANATVLFAVTNSALLISSGSAPTAGSCGTSPSLNSGSTDVVGSITWTGSAASCVVNFSHTLANAPFCLAETNGAAFAEPSITATAMTWTLSASLSGGTLTWFCICGKNGC